MKRFFWYFVGLNLIAAAVVLNIRYDFGVAAFSSVMYSISQIYHISLGTASIICYLSVFCQRKLRRHTSLRYRFRLHLGF